MVSVENSSLRGGGSVLKQAIWDAARETIEEWTGQELTQCSLYGIRVYTEGAILAPHVDRLPLVSSAIVNVAQDVDEPWPIEVYGHDGKAYNVTMEPGDMVLYESHSLLHGRPFPLKGRYFANVFIHFEPTGHTLRHQHSNGMMENDKKKNLEEEDVHEQYMKSVQRRQGGHENEEPSGLPIYILEGSEEADKWKLRHRDNKRSAKGRSFQTGSTAAHKAAQVGDVEGLKEIIDVVDDFINRKDANGWTPLHESCRGGHKVVAEILIERGANINELTNSGETPLYLALKTHGDDHPMVSFLRKLGGISLGPEL
jgi:prolyl 4-hydroxylase